MSRLGTFVRLAPADRALLLQGFTCLLSSRIRLRLQSFPKLQAWAATTGRKSATVDRLSWAIDLAVRLMPGTTCLCQALALQRLVSRHGHSSELRIGVNKSEGDFSAHAWLVHEGRTLIGGSGIVPYQQLFPFAAVGQKASRGSRPA